MPDHRRTYFGDIDTTGLVRGEPRVTGRATDMGKCPHCGCASLYDIIVPVECELLTTGRGYGMYVGCPACPFASPMLMIAAGARGEGH